MPIVRNSRVRPLKEFATRVGAKIKVEYTTVGEADYVLFDRAGERLTSASDTYDMLDALAAYFGGHEEYKSALEDFHEATQ